MIADENVVSIVDDKDLTSDFVGTTGVLRSLVGFKSAIAKHYYKIKQHEWCIKYLVKERAKQQINPNALLYTDPAWSEYLKSCTFRGLMERQYKEVTIKMNRTKAKAIVAALNTTTNPKDPKGNPPAL